MNEAERAAAVAAAAAIAVGWKLHFSRYGNLIYLKHGRHCRHGGYCYHC